MLVTLNNACCMNIVVNNSNHIYKSGTQIISAVTLGCISSYSAVIKSCAQI